MPAYLPGGWRPQGLPLLFLVLGSAASFAGWRRYAAADSAIREGRMPEHGRAPQALAEHAEILAAIRSRDPETAEIAVLGAEGAANILFKSGRTAHARALLETVDEPALQRPDLSPPGTRTLNMSQLGRWLTEPIAPPSRPAPPAPPARPPRNARLK